MKIVSLFSGAGGLDLGLIQAGHEVIWANDIDKDAVATYTKNISDHIVCADIKDVDTSTIPIADVIVGGFPCQGFSQANLRRTVDDERNQLYKFFYDAVKKNQPKFFIAENVRGILSLDGGNAIKQIVYDFENAGYIASVTLVNVADFGVPQTRQRVFIIGQRKNLNGDMLFRFPEKTHGKNGVPKAWISIKNALDRYPNPDEPNEYMNHIYSAYKLAYRNFTGHRITDPDKPSPTILARGNGKGGVCAIPHYNGQRRLTIRESAAIQTFPDDYEFIGQMNSCYRQIGNAVPVKFAKFLGEELTRLERDRI
ncbi:MAG: DNA cytosine methyltransferase [Defluviitaleaceae bacterium]|nr:DNA cytosine methyltransferase [Defluviitaleaceae bacterium]MCL2240137.1 DNA cytosine methyltransferase [Defluviitaleaceae bacterium]